MADDGKFVFESLQDKETIKDYLHALIDGVDKGKIVLSSNGEEIVLHPNELVRFAVKVKKKGGSSSLNVRIAWKDKRKGDDGYSDTIKISS